MENVIFYLSAAGLSALLLQTVFPFVFPIRVLDCPMSRCPNCGGRKTWSQSGESRIDALYALHADESYRYFCAKCEYSGWERDLGAKNSYCDVCALRRARKYPKLGIDYPNNPRLRFRKCWTIEELAIGLAVLLAVITVVWIS